jgi:hypothetical protein
MTSPRVQGAPARSVNKECAIISVRGFICASDDLLSQFALRRVAPQADQRGGTDRDRGNAQQ